MEIVLKIQLHDNAKKFPQLLIHEIVKKTGKNYLHSILFRIHFFNNKKFI